MDGCEVVEAVRPTGGDVDDVVDLVSTIVQTEVAAFVVAA